MCVGLIGGVGAIFSGRKAKQRLEKNRVKYGLIKAEIKKYDTHISHWLEANNIEVLKETELEYSSKIDEEIKKKRLNGLSKLFFKNKEATAIKFFEERLGVSIIFTYFKDGNRIV